VIEANYELARIRQAKPKSATDIREMYDLRAKAVKNEKRALGHEVGDYTRWAQQHRQRNRLEEASSLDRAIVNAKEQIAMIDQVLK